MKKVLFVLLGIFLSQGVVLAQSKVAHADFQVLLDTLPSRKAAEQDITRIQLEGQQELLTEKKKFDEAVAIFQRQVGAGELSPTLQQYEADRLTKMEGKLIAREKEITDYVQLLVQQSDARSMDLIKKAVEIVAKKKGLNYVLEMSTLLYANGTNITNEIIPELMLLDKQQGEAPKTNGQ